MEENIPKISTILLKYLHDGEGKCPISTQLLSQFIVRLFLLCNNFMRSSFNAFIIHRLYSFYHTEKFPRRNERSIIPYAASIPLSHFA